MYYREGRSIYRLGRTRRVRVAIFPAASKAALACRALNAGAEWRHYLTR